MIFFWPKYLSHLINNIKFWNRVGAQDCTSQETEKGTEKIRIDTNMETNTIKIMTIRRMPVKSTITSIEPRLRECE